MKHLLLLLSLAIVIAGSFYLGVLWCERQMPDFSAEIITLEYCRDAHAEWAEKDTRYLQDLGTNRERELEWVEIYDAIISKLEKLKWN